MSGFLLLRKSPHVRCLSSRLSQVRHYALIGKPTAAVEPRWVLPKTPARTRFAPSPTGYLHLGSLRTALYNYLLAQATGGQFVLRLEDTDQSRLVSDAEQVLYDDLRWAGLLWEEGPDKGGPFGPYRQSERLELYRQHADALLESGHAFRCFCTKQEMDFNVAQANARGGAVYYPGTCTHVELGESERRAANGEPHVIRFKPAEEPVPAQDLVYGTYRKAEREDSFIIMKSDGFPTYHFANVVDDHFMEITHVIRGAEWLISTPKHIELYNAFGWQPPNFAHVSLLVDAQRQKLSKRDMANIGISNFRSNDVLPGALLNFSALLGWDPNLKENPHLHKKGSMTMDEMKQNFTLKFTRGDIVVDLQKLKFFQSQLTRNLISGKNPDHDTLRTRIIQPILTELQKLDEKLQAYREYNRADDDPNVQSMLESIAPRSEEPALTEDYVLQILKASKGPPNSPTMFVHDNILAFYRPSKESMRKAFHELQAPMRKIMILEDETNKLLNVDISKVLRTFIHKLSKEIEPEEWTEKLDNFVYKLTDSVKYYNADKGQDNLETAGWKFLRHGVLNGNPGLGVLPIMKLLGKKETVDRMRNARKVASAEEDKAFEAVQKLKMKETEAAKVSTRRLTPGPRGEEAKQATTTRNMNQAGNVKVHEPRNQRILLLEEPQRTLPPPPGTGPFRVAVDKMKEDPFKVLTEGPFKSRGPTPSPPKSRGRDPSEVERAPKFLTPEEFNLGMRHFKTEDRGVALYKIEELQYQERARRRDQEATEAARVYVEQRNSNGGWIAPRTATPRDAQQDGRPEERGAFQSSDPLFAAYKTRVNQIYEDNKRHQLNQAMKAASAARRQEQIAAQTQSSQLTLQQRVGFVLEAESRKSMRGPFRPAGATSQIDDLDRHVKHLRALNRTAAFRKAERKHMDEETRFKRLIASGALRPLSLQVPGKQPAEDSKGVEKHHVLREARDPKLAEVAQEIAARQVARKSQPLPTAVRSSVSDFEYQMTRRAVAMSNEALKEKKDHKAETKRAERMIAELASQPKY